MQSLSWYLRRLRGMSAGEVAWRARSALRDASDRARVSIGARVGPGPERTRGLPDACGFRVTDLPLAAWAAAPAGSREAAWRDRLVGRADRIAQRRLSFFALRDRHLGDPIDWNRDHETGRPTPMGFAPAIDYRDHRIAGDAKVVWEPSRHHQLVVLGRAFRATGDERYATAMAEQLDSWLVQCPFPHGMQWRSPLELAIRLINWVWAIDLVREAGVVSGELRDRLLHAVHRHVWEVARKYSQGSSANNHLIGEAAGVFVATSYFAAMPGAGAWREQARAILLRECEAQTYADGCNKELALGYHVFALQFFLVAGLAARRTGDALNPAYWSAVERMLDFLAALGSGGDRLPLYGDADDGYVLDLGEPRGDWRGMLAAGALLFERRDLGSVAGEPAEAAAWLLGETAARRFEDLAGAGAPAPLESRAFPDSGHYLLQHGSGSGRVSVLFDCAELGFGAIAAHGHADALGIVVRVGGRDVLVDPGTYDYFRYPAWRAYFRGTAAHNTLAIDGCDQSEMQGLFLWGTRARARCLAWQPTAAGGRVVGEHDGYRRLPEPVTHRRSVELEGRSLTIRDELEGAGTHSVALALHFAADWGLQGAAGTRSELSSGDQGVSVELDPALEVRAWHGSEQPIAGWVSGGYHEKQPSLSLVGRVRAACPITLVTRLRFAAAVHHAGRPEPPLDQRE